MSVLQNGTSRFFDVTQDNVPGFGSYEIETQFNSGLSPAAAHTAGLSSMFSSTSDRFDSNAGDRNGDNGTDKLKLRSRAPGTYSPVSFSSFDRVTKYPKNSYVRMGTVSDSVRPLTQARDEREGIAAPGSYNLGSCFDRAARLSNERSGKGSSAFCNSGRQQQFTPDGKNIVCMPRAFGLNGEKLGPGSYNVGSPNWRNWRDARTAPSSVGSGSVVGSSRGSTPHSRQRSRFPDSRSISSAKRRPRRAIGAGETAVQPGTSQQRGTYHGLYSGMSR